MSSLLLALALVAQGNGAYTIDSKILGETRRVSIHLPRSFEKSAPSCRYSTIVCLDGKFMLEPVVATSDVLVREGQMPESVIVAIENVDDYAGRVRDLTPPGLSVSGSSRNERGDAFLDFIEKELLPALDAQFRTATPRTFAGTSSGGILVTYAAATRDTFRLHLALDAPTHLGDGWLAKKLLERARAKPSAPMRYATMDVRFGWSDAQWDALKSAAPPAWLLHRQKLEHESHNSMQFLGSYLGLRELFHDWSMLRAPEYPTTSVLPSYDKLTASYGAKMIPPEPLLERVIEDFLIEGRGAAARAAFDTLVAAYGEPRDAAQLRARIADVERQPAPTETVEGLLATPFPTPEEMRDYLGEWEGEQWIHPSDKHRSLVRFVVENGKVTGALVSWPEPGVELVQPLQYLKITPHGLSFGMMNGMRPRGVLLHEATREGDTLTGTIRFGGVNFTFPDGHVPKMPRFVLRKKR